MSSPTQRPTKTLRELREAQGWTQGELAERLGVDAGTVGKWERGRTRPRLGYLLSMARLFEVGIDEIAFGSGEGKE